MNTMSDSSRPMRLPAVTPSTGSDEYYLQQVRRILSQGPITARSSRSPTALSDAIFIGNYNDAADITNLRRLGITHVLNCAAWRQSEANPYSAASGIVGYLQFFAQDSPDYNILQHFPKAKVFVDAAVKAHGKVLIHCAAGVNRSGAMCAAYLMVNQRADLLDVLTRMKARRTLLLSNTNFQRQLVQFARRRNLLKPAAPPPPKEKGRRPAFLLRGQDYTYLVR